MAVYTHCCRAQPLRQLGFLVLKLLYMLSDMTAYLSQIVEFIFYADYVFPCSIFVYYEPRCLIQ